MKNTLKSLLACSAVAVAATGFAASSLFEAIPAALFATENTSVMDEPGISYSVDGIATVTSEAGWKTFASHLAADTLGTIKGVVLGSAIQFSNASVPQFELTVPFDGKGYTISDTRYPLFTSIAKGVEVKNLQIVRNSSNSPKAKVSYNNAPHGGTLACENYGTISSCYFFTECTIALDSAIAAVTDQNTEIAYGGVVGVNYGTIKDSYSNCILHNENAGTGAAPVAKVLPSSVCLGGVVGINETGGVVENIFCDYARIDQPFPATDDYGNTQGEDLFLNAKWNDASTSYYTGEVVGFDKNSSSGVNNVYCSNGIIVNGRLALKIDRPSMGSNAPQDSSTDFFNPIMTSVGSKFPSFSDLPSFSKEVWKFSTSYYDADNDNITYRTPLPRMGDETIDLGSLSVIGATAHVSSIDDWNHLSDALDLLSKVDSIRIEADLDASADANASASFYPIRHFDNVTLDGLNHTITLTSFYEKYVDQIPYTYSLIDTICANASVQNLVVKTDTSAKMYNNSATVLGLFASVNRGTINNSAVIAEFNSPLNTLMYMKDGADVALGSVVGINEGTISNIYANVIHHFEAISYPNFVPKSVNVGALVGKNVGAGQIKNVVIDNVSTYVSEYGVKSQYVVSPLQLGSNDQFVVSTLPSQFGMGYVAGSNTGTTVTNVYAPSGIFSSMSLSSSYAYGYGNPRFVLESDTTKQVKVEISDRELLTEFDKKWVPKSAIASLFSSPDDWGFNLFAPDRSSLVPYRTPVPSIIATANPDFLSSLSLDEDGVSIISSAEQWNGTAYALEDGLGGITGVKLGQDLYASGFTTFLSLNVPFDGGGHTVESSTYPIVDSISTDGIIKNLNVKNASMTVGASKFGGLARVNYGSVESVYFQGTITVPTPAAFDGPDVAIGGLIGENFGSISSTSVATAIVGNNDNSTYPDFSFKSMYLSNFVARNEGSMNDCYVGSVSDFDRIDTLIDFSSSFETEVSIVAESEPSLGIGAIVGKNNGTIGKALCTNTMLDDCVGAKQWFPSPKVYFSVNQQPYTFDASSWCAEDRNLIEITTEADGAVEEGIFTSWATDDNLFNFDDPALWTFNCPSGREAIEGDYQYRFPLPNMLPRKVTSEADPQTQSLILSVADSASVKGVFDLLSDINSALFRVAKVDFSDNISYDYNDLDFESLTADKIAETMDELPLIPNFGGILNGSTVSNLQAQMSGLFGSVDEDAQVNNLVFDNVAFYVDPTDPKYIRSNDTIYVDLLTKDLYGEMNNVGVSGVVIVDDTKLSQLGTDTTIVIVLIGENGADAVLTGFVFLDDAQTPAGNKKMIPMKQNLCTGKIQKSKRKKVALREDGGNKDLGISFNPDEKRFKQDECLFSVDEFASGLVAYWLNFDGPGFTGNYTGHWSQGSRVPVASPSVAKALYPVEISSDNISYITDAPQFANGGSLITLKFSAEPVSVKVGDKSVSFSGTEVSLLFTGDEKISVTFTPSALDEVKTQDITVSISGSSVSVSGAEGLTKEVYDVAGRQVARTSADNLHLAPGLYVLRCAGVAKRLIVK